MATPRGAEHRDLEQRLRDLEDQVRRLSAASLRQRQLSVTQGDFVVTGGGSVIVQDGGHIQAFDVDGTKILDAGGSQGILRPFLPWAVHATDGDFVPANNTTATSYDRTAAAFAVSQHPYVKVWVSYRKNGGGTGRFRLALWDFTTSSWSYHHATSISNASTQIASFVVPLPAVDYQELSEIDLQAEVSGGGGSVDAAITYAVGVDSLTA